MIGGCSNRGVAILLERAQRGRQFAVAGDKAKSQHVYKLVRHCIEQSSAAIRSFFADSWFRADLLY